MGVAALSGAWPPDAATRGRRTLDRLGSTDALLDAMVGESRRLLGLPADGCR